MPELPEVETIKRELDRVVLGKKIVDIIVNKPKVIKEPTKDKFISGLKNAVIKKILRKGKGLIFQLSNGKSLVIHLRMTGQLIYPGNATVARVSFELSDGKLLDFNDRRLLGELRLVDNWQDMKFFRELGPEIYDLTIERFAQMLSTKTTKIKSLLMDQTFICGIGNLYAAEALFRAGIHPLRTANSLSNREKQRLFKEIKDTLNEAIRYRGSSIDQYVQLSGQRGGYVKYHKVYGREGQACVKCKTKIKRISLGGRGTYFCPKCQK
jgi:formamidopyrimidine-DNA glycosylase